MGVGASLETLPLSQTKSGPTFRERRRRRSLIEEGRLKKETNQPPQPYFEISIHSLTRVQKTATAEKNKRKMEEKVSFFSNASPFELRPQAKPDLDAWQSKKKEAFSHLLCLRWRGEEAKKKEEAAERLLQTRERERAKMVGTSKLERDEGKEGRVDSSFSSR